MESKHTATPIALSIGGVYATRGGGLVTIRAIDDEDGRYFGDIVDQNGNHVRIASFTESGRYMRERETEFDIVALSLAGAA